MPKKTFLARGLREVARHGLFFILIGVGACWGGVKKNQQFIKKIKGNYRQMDFYFEKEKGKAGEKESKKKTFYLGNGEMKREKEKEKKVFFFWEKNHFFISY